jgi:phosphatidylinositol alpha-mannosyltransferase
LLRVRFVKIVLVTEFYYPHPGGVTEHVHHLARHLALAGHEVRVITSHVDEAPRRPEREEVEGFEVVRMGRGVPIESNGSQARVTIGFGLERRMQEALTGAELCHVQSPLFPMLPYLALKAARKLGVPTVGTFHTHFDGSRAARAFGPVVRRYAAALDRSIAVSRSAARSVRQFVAGCVLIPNGVDVAAWAAGRPRPELAGTRNAVFLGRLDPRNDVGVLVDAFARLARARDRVRLVLVGDGPGRAAWEALATAKLDGRVVFAGVQASVQARADYLASAHVMAFTARIVSHPMALLEGLAAGLPAVAYDIEGVRELVSEGREGYKVQVGDPTGLEQALEKVLSDEPHRRAMGKLAHARAERYDWREIGMRIEAEYRAAQSGMPGALKRSA